MGRREKRKIIGRMADQRDDIYEDGMALQLVTPECKTGFAKIRFHGRRFISLEQITEEEYIDMIGESGES